MKLRFFVIMPFGKKEVKAATFDEAGNQKSPAKEADFDQIYEMLIRPALLEAGVEPFRADDEASAGDIRTDMYFELVTADFVLADISILNPNVFYELGVRHGVAPRGVLVVEGGWNKRPFDVAPDRVFKFNGALFETPIQGDAAWEARVQQEMKDLAARLRNAVAYDDRSIGSPVYKELAGLKPVDWKSIQAAKAKYFQGVLEDWQKRVRIARNEGRPGDILTLAADAPTRYHHATLLYRAANALIDLNRMKAAQNVLEELLEVDREHFEARCLLGQVLARLGHYAKAEEELRNAVQLRQGDPEAHGMLGRVYKDLWRSRWQDFKELKDRQQTAMDYASLAAKAANSYGTAFQARMNSYYLGINLLGLQKLLEHLAQVTGEGASEGIELSPEAIATIVRIGATQELKKSRQDGNIAEEAWTTATLGELELLMGNEKEALRMYQSAGALPGISYFHFDSMRSQLELYRLLEFRLEAVDPILKKLDRYIEQTRRPALDFKNVILFSGHIIDRPGRKESRFPPDKEGVVRQHIAALLDEWKIGQSDLAMCGGAAGGDILFAELCLERGAHVRLLLASPLPEFMESSVRLPTGNWDIRLRALIDGVPGKGKCELWYQHERLGEPPEGRSIYERVNQWLIDTARVEAKPEGLFALVVWDEKSSDKTGGTADFVQKVEQLGAIYRVINPTKL